MLAPGRRLGVRLEQRFADERAPVGDVGVELVGAARETPGDTAEVVGRRRRDRELPVDPRGEVAVGDEHVLDGLVDPRERRLERALDGGDLRLEDGPDLGYHVGKARVFEVRERVLGPSRQPLAPVGCRLNDRDRREVAGQRSTLDRSHRYAVVAGEAPDSQLSPTQRLRRTETASPARSIHAR